MRFIEKEIGMVDEAVQAITEQVRLNIVVDEGVARKLMCVL